MTIQLQLRKWTKWGYYFLVNAQNLPAISPLSDVGNLQKEEPLFPATISSTILPDNDNLSDQEVEKAACKTLAILNSVSKEDQMEEMEYEDDERN